MTAIRHTLQKHLFEPDDERLISTIHVIAHGRKRKPYFLCFTVTSQHPISLRLYQIKQGDRGVGYSKKRVWFLRDVKVIDGINPRKLTAEFELTVDKPYRFTVTNATEKEPFIRQLFKFTARYLPAQRPDFINVSLPVEDLDLAAGGKSDGRTSVSHGLESVSQQEEDAEEYQPITAKEEADFRRLLSKCQMTIGEAEKFAENLNRELSMLDGANIQAIMGGEEQIAELMNKMDQAIEEAAMLEQTLDSYDALLAHVRDGVETMEEKDKLLRTHANNRRLLMEELESFVTLLALSPDHQKTLLECNLSDPSRITRAAQAALALQKCIKAKVPPGMEKMNAYVSQIRAYQQISDQFAERLVAHLSALFRNLATNDNGWNHSGSSSGTGLSLQRHDYVHTPLKPFSDLVMWLKQSVPDGYKILLERYISAFKEVYRKEAVSFFDTVKQHVRISNFERKPTLMKGAYSSDVGRTSRSPSTQLDAAGNMVNEADQFRALVETILREIEPVVVAEQKFTVWWFHVSSDLMSSIETRSTGSNDSGSTGTPERRLERQFNDQVRSILGQLLEQLDIQMQDFVGHCERANPLYLMQLLALLSNRAIAIQDTGSYLSVVLGKISVIVKRRFDTFMESQMLSLGDVRVLKRTKLAVLDNLKNFEELAQQAESAFQGSSRRGDLDRWYPPLLGALMDGIEKAAEDPNSKAPPAVVRMENYHYLFSSLSQLKIGCVEQQRKEAKQRYQNALDSYVKEYMGKPLEKLQGHFPDRQNELEGLRDLLGELRTTLEASPKSIGPPGSKKKLKTEALSVSTFFEQIESCIEQGMKPEEIGYQQAFNKQELRKAVAAYTVKEVGKGLDGLYKKVQKHLSDEDRLLQVVWRNMQDEFIQQYKHYEQLIGQCYPNSNIQLEFTIQDLLQCFSDIAQQH